MIAANVLSTHERPGGLASAFVTFEGGEGSGKTTQLRLLEQALAGNCVVTREPGGTPFAEAVREALLNGAIAPFGTEVEAIAFAAARADHVHRLIRPHLDAGKVVLCDRFIDSSRAYQRDAGAIVEPLQRIAIERSLPDLTLIFDLDPELGRERVRARDGALDRFEGSAAAELHRRRAEFLAIAAREPVRCAVIDAAGDPAEVHGRVIRVVNERLPGLPFGREGMNQNG